MFVFDHHAVSTLSARDHALQKCGPRTWDPTRLVAIVGSVVVGEHLLDLLKGGPGNIRGVDIGNANLPLVLWEPDLFCARRGGISMDGTRATIGKGTHVGRVFEDLQDSCHGGSLPDQIAEAIAPRQQQVVAIEKLQHLTCRAFLQEGGKYELQAILHFLMRVLVHASGGITDEAHGQGQSQLAPASFVQESGGHAGADGMQFQFRKLSLQPEQ